MDDSTPTSERSSPALGSNPLLDSRDLRMPRIADPCVLVMFGITGDLARHKLLPAIYDLANRGLLSPSFSLVGVGRRSWSDDELRAYVEQAVRAGAAPLAPGHLGSAGRRHALRGILRPSRMTMPTPA